jgi:ATPase subunit of ABC transporter with duplicated ATPase domains
LLILKATNVSKEWNGKLLFEQISIDIAPGERIALFGRNGTGKTTLLNIFLGRIQADAGTIRRELPLEEWGWMDQQLELSEDCTLLEFVQSGSHRLSSLKTKMEALQQQLQNGQAGTEAYEIAMQQYGDVYEQYVLEDGYGWEARVEKGLQQMRLDKSVWRLPLIKLSGGQKTRAQLARLMIRQPKFLLLDEPTNHLDAETLAWLEEWLLAYVGAVLFVSHDRAFIDKVAHAVYELTPNGGKKYTGGYSDYKARKDIERRAQEALYRKQQQIREDLLECIRTYRQWFGKAHRDAKHVETKITQSYFKARATKHTARLRAKEKELERLEKQQVEKPRESGQLKMELKAGSFAAQTLLRMVHVDFAYSTGQDRVALFQDVDLSVDRGDRLAVLGQNGVGKSTLLKLMIGHLTPTSGEVKWNPQAKIGYFSQELDNLQMSATLLDSLLELPSMTQTFARTILGCFLFSREDVFKRIGDLSMGEKCRVAFLKLYFSGANVLVLDEPTNYLDIETRERIEEALMEYAGALILVSHDRYFVRKAANRIVMLYDGARLESFSGTYEEYLEHNRRKETLAPDPETAAEIAGLELKLVQWMAEDAGTLHEQTERMERIRELRGRLEALRGRE